MEIPDIDSYLKPAFESINPVLTNVRSDSELMVWDPSKYDGWVDGKDGYIYFAIFDKRFKKGQDLSDLFKAGSVDGFKYRFVPADDFVVEGKLILHKTHENLEWIALQTTISSDWIIFTGC